VEQPPSVIVRWLAAGDRGDVDAFDDLLHADAVVHARRGLSTNSRAAEKSVWLEALAAMPDLRHNIQEVIVEGDVEMARVIVTGTLMAEFGGVAGSGGSFQMDQAVICHLREGMIAEAWGRSPTWDRLATRPAEPTGPHAPRHRNALKRSKLA
jgi:ketosteroid isomerase-like protein